MTTSLYLQLSRATNENSLRVLLDSDEYAFRFEVGITDVSSRIKLSDCDRIA